MSKRWFCKEPLNCEELTPIDRAALELAIEVTRKESPARRCGRCCMVQAATAAGALAGSNAHDRAAS